MWSCSTGLTPGSDLCGIARTSWIRPLCVLVRSWLRLMWHCPPYLCDPDLCGLIHLLASSALTQLYPAGINDRISKSLSCSSVQWMNLPWLSLKDSCVYLDFSSSLFSHEPLMHLAHQKCGPFTPGAMWSRVLLRSLPYGAPSNAATHGTARLMVSYSIHFFIYHNFYPHFLTAVPPLATSPWT